MDLTESLSLNYFDEIIEREFQQKNQIVQKKQKQIRNLQQHDKALELKEKIQEFSFLLKEIINQKTYVQDGQFLILKSIYYRIKQKCDELKKILDNWIKKKI